MKVRDLFALLQRRWPPALARHRVIVQHYLAHLRDQGFGHRQILFISSNIAAFLQFLLRHHKNLRHTRLQDVENYFRQVPYNLQTERGKARRTYVLRFLAFTLPDRARLFQRPPRYGLPPKPFGIVGRDCLNFCRIHQGQRDSTVRPARTLLSFLEAFLARRGIRDLRRLSLADIDAFFLARTRRSAPATQKILLGRLRNFFRFLYLKGHLSINWAPRLMPPSLFQKNLRPKYLPWRQVEEFLGSIDRSSPLGKRDYAMALLMATLGLRARELAALRVKDIDLPNRQIHLPERKGGRADLFPLSQALINALADYLSVRSPVPFEELFLSVRPPVKPLGPYVREAVSIRLARHFGLPRSMRVYLLRHSFAKRLLDNGAPLPDIGAVLGHRSLSSTLIYTRVDTRSLREVSDNYADLLPLPPGMKKE